MAIRRWACAATGAYADGNRLVMWDVAAAAYRNQKWIIQSDGAGNYIIKRLKQVKALDAFFLRKK